MHISKKIVVAASSFAMLAVMPTVPVQANLTTCAQTVAIMCRDDWQAFGYSSEAECRQVEYQIWCAGGGLVNGLPQPAKLND